MVRTKTRMGLCICLLIVNLAFIWGNSLLPGSVSGALSGWLRDLLSGILPGGPSGGGHGLLRKLAHFTEFACLGLSFTWLFGMLRKSHWLAFAGGVLAAGMDEAIQLCVPDRGPSIWDVLLDSAGVAFGVVLLTVICIRIRKKQAKKLEDTMG